MHASKTTGSSGLPSTPPQPTSSYEPFLPSNESNEGNFKFNRFRNIELWASIGSSIVVMWLL
ncbi:14398_t:CDS:2 [Cetraspora pellucida]|uniref:14398_t:CDS:1 n=1 Tax=Cetraspora pellucida TaxID=1433469 RepID=A0ACA9K3Q1_9GLOM|nr:14398_t:CDS:2 [Cetraspora pellucida]